MSMRRVLAGSGHGGQGQPSLQRIIILLLRSLDGEAFYLRASEVQMQMSVVSRFKFFFKC